MDLKENSYIVFQDLGCRYPFSSHSPPSAMLLRAAIDEFRHVIAILIFNSWSSFYEEKNTEKVPTSNF